MTSIENEEKKNPAPFLYDLTELQRDCNRKYGLSAQKTLDIVQDLYEKEKWLHILERIADFFLMI